MKNSIAIDINADMGESFGRWVLGNDAALIPMSHPRTSPAVFMRAILISCGNACAWRSCTAWEWELTSDFLI